MFALGKGIAAAIPLPANASCQEAITALKALELSPDQEPKSDKRHRKHLQGIADRATPDQLNSYGMRCYKKQRLNDAAWLFDMALAQDSEHVLASKTTPGLSPQSIRPSAKAASSAAVVGIPIVIKRSPAQLR